MTEASDERVRLYTVKEFADAFRKSSKTVRRWIRDGKVEAARFGDRGHWLIRVKKG